MAKDVTVSPRYLPYDKDDVERILGQVETLDDTPTEESENPVKSGGVAAAIAELNNTFTNYPTTEQMNTALAPLQVTEEEFNSIFYPSDSSSSD